MKPAEFKRIIVIVTRQIGDVLLTTPLIHATKQRWPNAKIDILGFAGTLGILQGNADISERIEVPAGSTWRSSLPLIRKLWRRYDLALVAQHTDRAHLYGWVAAKTRSGQVAEGERGGLKSRLLKHRFELGGQHSHVVLEKLKLITPWIDDTAVPVVVPPEGRPLDAALATRLGADYVVIQVPSLVNYKQWPIRHFVELVKGLCERGRRVVLSGGPSDTDRALVREVLNSCAAWDVINVCGQLTLNQMATLLSGASLYVGPDTSITHLATACGTPTIALFGPIDPRLWGPWPKGWPSSQPYEKYATRQERGNVVLLQGSPACVPCNQAGCDNHAASRSECLETMAPQRVLAEADALLASTSVGIQSFETGDNRADE